MLRLIPMAPAIKLLTIDPACLILAMSTPALRVTMSSVIMVCTYDLSGNSARWYTLRPTKPKPDDVYEM